MKRDAALGAKAIASCSVGSGQLVERRSTLSAAHCPSGHDHHLVLSLRRLNGAVDRRYIPLEMISARRTVPRLGACDVHVWRLPLVGDGDHHVGSLSAAERVRLERRHGVRRNQFAITHGATRQVLGSYLACAAAEVPIEGCYGQPPRVAGLELSLTHCDELALLAVAFGPVGVDVESAIAGDDEDLELLAEATLAWEELRGFREAAPEERSRSWLRSWVRKEAVLKARGLGLGDHALCDLDVSGEHVGQLALVDLDVGSGHVAALAITPPAWRITVQEWVDEPR